MLTYRTGALAGPAAAKAMADHLLEATIPAAHAELAAYCVFRLIAIMESGGSR